MRAGMSKKKRLIKMKNKTERWNTEFKNWRTEIIIIIIIIIDDERTEENKNKSLIRMNYITQGW
jgi:hypothetical protein